MRFFPALLTVIAASLPAMTSLGQEPPPPTAAAPVAPTPQGIPVATTFAPEPVERFSTPMMATGIGLTVLGFAGAVVGSAFVFYGGTACPNQDSECLPSQELGYAYGTLALSLGSAVAGAGISLWVVGGDDEPASARALPSVRLGLTSAELQWAF
jgi:hypothetical protein